MALWRCKACGTRFAVGLHCCPQCTGTSVEEDDGMAKITRHGGPTDAGATVSRGLDVDGVVHHHVRDLTDDESAPEPIPPEGPGASADPDAPGPDGEELSEEGGDQSSPGNSSETSPEQPQTSSGTSEADRPKLARTTGSRSSKARKGSSSARSTATSGQGTGGE